MTKAEADHKLAAVAKVVDKYTVVINRGSDHGVSLEARYQVFGIGDEVMDPETNKSLGKLEIVKGLGVVSHVQPTMATVTSSRTRRPSPSVRTIKRSGGTSSLIASFYGRGNEETVEEREGEPVQVPFDDVEVGDLARPI